MRLKKSMLFLMWITMLLSFTNDNNRVFHFGKRTCTLKSQGSSDTLAVFISLHDDENTAVEAFLSVADTLADITLYELQQVGDRFLKYDINKRDYLFDPNCIFSKAGIQTMLAKYNREYPAPLANKLKDFADTLLNIIQPSSTQSYIVSLHNNTDEKFSILSYKHSNNAAALYISPNEDIDDFFIVTSKDDFNYFKALKQNVVLQSKKAVDDGSLSIYCHKHHIPYINIEAEHGHKTQQVRMIEQVYGLLRGRVGGIK